MAWPPPSACPPRPSASTGRGRPSWGGWYAPRRIRCRAPSAGRARPPSKANGGNHVSDFRAGPADRRDFTVRCAECRAAASLPAYRCDACAGPLVLDLAEPSGTTWPDGRGIWRRGPLLPRGRATVTLGEGDTPLLPLSPSGLPTGVEVYAKIEGQSPTLSFKDRGMALTASLAVDLGVDGLALASSGNAAVSAAAYAAAAGLRCAVFCGTGSRADAKLAAARAYGAQVHVVDGDYSAAYARATQAEADGVINVTTTYRNPVPAEAYRTIAVEIHEQLSRVPDVVVVPVGAGPLLYGVHAGFVDLVRLGLTDGVPRMVGVQAAACAPLARAWSSTDWRAALAEPSPPGATAATAIADPLRGYEREGLLTLEAVRASGGRVVAVTERAIGEAVRNLARDGLLAESAAAAAVAALSGASLGDVLRPGTTVVALLTGHGVKEPATLEGIAPRHGVAQREGG
ncbi:MAG: pyridoxal-phosphate dependent enzyme [Streptosporangiales bacterium]|nr:pyridoxal-phosphate dependent enzyme [Streptosporangiales bacterium]